MKISDASSVVTAFEEGARGLLDILGIGATAMEDRTPEADACNLRNDLEQIAGDFWQVISEIESGTLSE
jgi:hypothetical protein